MALAGKSRPRPGTLRATYAVNVLLFGPETRGLPAAVLDELGAERILRIPMVPGSRSLNLANAVAIVIYEAWRQNGFAGAADSALSGQPAG